VVPLDDAALAAWRARIATGRAALGWPVAAPTAARRHRRGTTLAIAAPLDQLFAATEVNEWALCATFAERDPARWQAMLAAQRALPADDAEAAAAGDPTIVDLYLEDPGIDDAALLERLRRRAAQEARPALRRAVEAAGARGLAVVLDDELLTLGAGARSRSWPVGAPPDPAAVPWAQLASVPTALVTGSNGKTTTVRLIAAALRAHGLRTGLSSTDGVAVDGLTLVGGDYSGPAGARAVLRHPEVEAAVLETARGGILRRGLAVERADVAVVTNVSADHFGEYGIDDLVALVAVKLCVARALGAQGTLVLNVDDPRLAALAPAATGPAARAWSALDADGAALVAARARGEACCGVRRGRLLLWRGGAEHDLGPIAGMPIAFGGEAAHNVANLAAAALAAAALGVGPDTIARCWAGFGRDPADNLGRMMRFERDGVQVMVDYAHNVDGLAHLRPVVEALRGRRARRGRLALLLGHAGNRLDDDIRAVVDAALELRPDLVVVKEIAGMARGRAPGEVAALVRGAVLARGVAADAVVVELDEVAAAERALRWAAPGDAVLLLLHGAAARAEVIGRLRR
jgi:UDP-N-acetylmuramyl tripeptide synthase